MKCLDCDCEMRPVRLEAGGYEMLVTAGMFQGRGVEGMACPMCGRLKLRVKMPTDMRKVMEQDPERRRHFAKDK